uniref:Inosine/uridine-preferring nucleoside hydrolase domain-containing protein n=1 Tax=Polytomella parva TaxID=51329 RepID=A0A7S0YHA1_9CHLO|mmetsp:Transcript_19668/g.35472  ORF Transcript_19668/g.35472 Transcript_19668/m.35472 type:complete len:384 (+) Transcript_19668:108-1259(+)
MTGQTKLIIDTDPGIDDAMAILMAFNCEELDVLGLTTIYGNVPTVLATENALRLVELAGSSQVEVAQGSLCALKSAIEEIRIANFVHGDDGFGDIGYPSAIKQALSDLSAAEFIVQKINEFPGEVSILALAGLTNIAKAILLDPSLPTKWKELVILGGAYFVNGNINPAAEANIFADPDAADLVFGSGERIRVVGLDVTHECCLSSARLDELGGISHVQAQEKSGVTNADRIEDILDNDRIDSHDQANTNIMDSDVSANSCKTTEISVKSEVQGLGKYGRFVHAIAQFYLNYHRRSYNMNAIYLHDPTALVALIRPELFGWRRGAVRVVCDGVARGHTILDANLKTWHGPNGWTEKDRPKIQVALEVKHQDVVDCIFALLSKQ